MKLAPILHIFVLLSIMASGLHGRAEEPTFGGEIELTRNKMWTTTGWEGSHNLDLETEAAYELAEAAIAACKASGECTFERVKGKWWKEWKITFQDGWWFQLSWDPGVVEIITAPATLKTMRAHKKDIDKYIFKMGADLGLKPLKRLSNHVNIGFKSAFNEDAELFLRFFVDYANHPDLALGGLGSDKENGPPLSILDQDQRDALKEIIREFNQGKYKTATEIAVEIQKRVYTTTSYFEAEDSYHYQAMGLKSIAGIPGKKPVPPERQRIELRSVRSQLSAEHMITLSSLFRARINFLKGQRGQPIIYLDSHRKRFTNQELYNRLYVYVSEMGLSFEKYKLLFTDTRGEFPLDPLIEGKANPKKKDFLEKNKKWLPDLATSSFVRGKFPSRPSLCMALLKSR